MSSKHLTIGQAAKLSGIPPKTIRYYEDYGILPRAERNDVGYRIYSGDDLRRLELVKRIRMLDMGLPEVRQLVEWASAGTCSDFQEHLLDTVRSKLSEVDSQIAQLQRLKEDLNSLERSVLVSEKEVSSDHSILDCSIKTCSCIQKGVVCARLTRGTR